MIKSTEEIKIYYVSIGQYCGQRNIRIYKMFTYLTVLFLKPIGYNDYKYLYICCNQPGK